MSLDLTRISPRSRRSNGRVKDCQGSRVANGSALIPGVDGRSVWVRRAKEIINEATSDCGGDAVVSAATRSLIRRAAVLTVECERLEARFASSDTASLADLDLYQKQSNTLRRTLQAISPGLRRQARDVTAVPTLSEYLARREAAE